MRWKKRGVKNEMEKNEMEKIKRGIFFTLFY